MFYTREEAIGINSRSKVAFFSISKEQTLLLKGIAILMVILGHMDYITWGGAGGVTIFLILSGYGIHESTRKNGIQHYWKKRLLKVWLPYVIVTVFVLIGKQISDIKRIIFSLIGLDFGIIADKSMWYISYIMLWYLGYYIIALVLKKRNDTTYNLLFIIFISLLPVLFKCLEMIGVWPLSRGSTVYLFAFPLGIVLSSIGNVQLVKKLKLSIWSILLLVTTAYLYSVYTQMYDRRMALAWGINVLSVVTLIKFSGLIKRILLWLGTHSYQMYLFEMILLDRYGWFDRFSSKFLADISIFFTVCIMSVVYKQIYDSLLTGIE